ncbi:MAG: hypothetical protein JWL77_300 [Chthonomonadaceae bacterium]|nr:hypothetical protein [Chthonomonadaceae bacterium]
MPGKRFFATTADMEPGISAFEAQWKVKYVRTGLRPSLDIETYYSALNLPDLGFAVAGDVSSNTGYYVLPIEANIVVEHVLQRDGEILYRANEKDNPSAFLFRPGGWYEDKHWYDGRLIGGGMGTLSAAEDAQAYYRAFARAFTKGFTTIPDVWNQKWSVGPEAVVLLDTGVRLITRNLSAPGVHRDLKRSYNPQAM